MRRLGRWVLSAVILGWLGLDLLTAARPVGVGASAMVDPGEYRVAPPPGVGLPLGNSAGPLSKGDPGAIDALERLLRADASGCRWTCGTSGAFDLQLRYDVSGAAVVECTGPSSSAEYCGCLQGAVGGHADQALATQVARRRVGCHGPWGLEREAAFRMSQVSLAFSAMVDWVVLRDEPVVVGNGPI